MALSDPQSIVLATVTTPLPRTETDKSAAVYKSADGTIVLTVSHQYGRRNRSVVRIDKSKITTNPLNDVRSNAVLSTYILVDRKEGDFTIQEMTDVITALKSYADATFLPKFLGGQS